MSKSKGNVVSPDDMIKKYGADALRTYILFMAPPQKKMLNGTIQELKELIDFLNKVWNTYMKIIDKIDNIQFHTKYHLKNQIEKDLRRKLHRTIEKK